MGNNKYVVMADRINSDTPIRIGHSCDTYEEAINYCVNECIPYVEKYSEGFAENAEVWVVAVKDAYNPPFADKRTIIKTRGNK